MSGIFSIGGGGDAGFYSFPLEQSLRFNDNDSAYLSRTPSSDGNLRKWVWSGWVKKNTHNQSGGDYIFYAGDASSNDTAIYWYGGTGSVGDQLVFEIYTGGTSYNIRTDAKFRDASAWYHIVAMLDTTQATASNRMKLYVNGEEITNFSASSYPTQNLDSMVNDASFEHFLGRRGSSYADIYMAEVHLVDGLSFFSDTSGTANTSFNINSFGQTKNGIWIPKQYTGSYGTNGFRLTFEDDTTVEGFNTVLYTGSGNSRTVHGVGFQPDFIWIKSRSNADPHELIDSVRGASKRLRLTGTSAESTASNDGFVSIDADGYTLDGTGGGGQVNGSGRTYAAWNWKAGGAPTADNSAGQGNVPTAGSVKIDGANSSTALSGTLVAKRISANTTRGFSIVTFNSGSTDNVTLDHGLGAVPKWIITRPRDNSGSWLVYHSDQATDPSTGYLSLEGTGTFTDDDRIWNDTMPTSTLVTLGNVSYNFGDNKECIMYCWSEISGYSKFGSYTGTGSSNKITTGFKPAFVLIKSYDQTRNWIVWDNTRTATNPADGHFHTNADVAEQTGTDTIQFDSDGFTLLDSDDDSNANTYNYIYVAFADTREYAFWTDQSGNNNDFQHVNLEHNDVVLDRPTNNFATLNPLDKGSGVTLSNGNLVTDLVADDAVLSTIHFDIDGDESYYAEMLCQTTPNNNSALGIVISNNSDRLDDSGGAANTYWYFANGNKRSTGSATSYGATWTTGDIIGIAVSGGAVTFYKNNASQGQAFTGLTGSYSIAIGEFNGNGPALRINYGQDSSFGGLKTPQGNADVNGNGDFFYAPPSNHLALCTDNLPDPGINPNAGESPDDYFNTRLYNGTGSSNSVTGVGFAPDWTWIKRRNSSSTHKLMDTVRGDGNTIAFNNSNEEQDDSSIFASLDSDGFTVAGTSNATNASGGTYVSWNWKAGGAASTIAADSISSGVPGIASSVSASPEAGFSIVTYTGTGSATTIGHGLNEKPQMILVKNRGVSTREWLVYNEVSGATKYMFVTNNQANSDSSSWNNTEPTSSVFTVGSSASSNNLNEGHVAYCFHSVEGYSKIGSYEGNADADGAFVYTGFRPAWVLFKRIDASASWVILDNKRDVDNPVEHILFHTSAIELEPYDRCDFLSNGFKLRDTGSGVNNADTVLYMAFAEQPFKYANAK